MATVAQLERVLVVVGALKRAAQLEQANAADADQESRARRTGDAARALADAGEMLTGDAALVAELALRGVSLADVHTAGACVVREVERMRADLAGLP